MIYFDNNATTPLRPCVIDKMNTVMQEVGNASSVHGAGRRARSHIETARRQVATLIGCIPENVIFTSGGTESLVTVLSAYKDAPILTSTTEHPAITHNSKQAIRIPVDKNGAIDLATLEKHLKEDAPKLICSILLNNETGVIQKDVAVISDLAHKYGALHLVDAVQAPGKMHIDWKSIGADFMALSAHKLGGPQGVGALIKATGVDLPKIMYGGTQERRQRAGTENVAGIAGFGEAARETLETAKDTARIKELHDQLEAFLEQSSPHVKIWGKNGNRAPNTTLLTLEGAPSETLIMILDLSGIAAGAGSACSSGTMRSSHVLKAMGASDAEASSTLRLSLGWANTADDIEKFKPAWLDLLDKIGHKLSS